MSAGSITLVVVAALLLAGLGLLVGARVGLRTKRSRPPSNGEDQNDFGGSAVGRSPKPGDVMLVPLPSRTNEALVLGAEHSLAPFDDAGLTSGPSAHSPGPLPQLARAVLGTAGAGSQIQAQRDVMSGRIVRLTDDTVRHMRSGRPVYDSAGNMLGVIKGDRGKWKHVARFDRAGTQAITAANAATLAMTVAVGMQLEGIERQLEEISATLGTMMREKDQGTLAKVEATNLTLEAIVAAVRRRGITETDMAELGTINLAAVTDHIEAEQNLSALIAGDAEQLNRAERVDRLDKLPHDRLEFWLTTEIQAELARTRAELIRLHWEVTKFPATAPEVTEKVRAAIRARQARRKVIGDALRDLTDPEARTRLDPLRLISRYQLGKEHAKMVELLETHASVFSGPDGSETPAIAASEDREPPSREVPSAGSGAPPGSPSALGGPHGSELDSPDRAD